MATTRNRRELLPFVVDVDGQEYEIHPDGRVYHRRPRLRLRCLHQLTQSFRTEEATLRRVKDPKLVAKVREAAKGVRWTSGLGL